MTTILERVTEPAHLHDAFFHSPGELLKAQDWLQKHGVSKLYCTTLLNIHNRWRREPQKALSRSDIQRLYGCTRKTAGRLLEVLAAEGGYALERVQRRNGADGGYLMRRAGSDQRQTAPAGTGEHREDAASSVPRTQGVTPEDQGVSSTTQGGDFYDAPSKTSSKNPIQEPEQHQSLSRERSRASLTKLHWGQDEEDQFQAALDVFARQQARRGGIWELEAKDHQCLLEAAKRVHQAHQSGVIGEPGLTQRLADALGRAEAHAWALGRPFPHRAGKHFGVHLQHEPFERVVPSGDGDANPWDCNCDGFSFPDLWWCTIHKRWQAYHENYCGETFPLADEMKEEHFLGAGRDEVVFGVSSPVATEPLETVSRSQDVPVVAVLNRGPASIGLSGLDLEREKLRQIQALKDLLRAPAQ